MSRTPVEKFYSGQTIFLTGSTGFVGKLIIEKLLRTCYDIEKLYILVRVKRNKTAEQRFKEIFDHACFDRLKNERPNFKNKLEMIEGDCEAANLGLSETDERKLINEVTCVFHGAATIRFDEKLRKAVNINVRAVRYILKLAKQMPKLKAFVHISTAYSNCVHENIDEKFYEYPIEVDKFLNIIEAVDDKTLDTLTPHLLGKWPNTYVFTKALAEQVIREEAVGLPVAIVRPSIIVSTIEEPMPGWIDNFYNIVGLALVSYLGILRINYVQSSEVFNMIPCDFVVNHILCVAWNIEDEKTSSVKVNRDEQSQIPIYNMTMPESSTLPADEFSRINIENCYKYPSNKMIYRFCNTVTDNLLWYRICDFLGHTVPAYIIDFILIILCKKPLAVKGYNKINKLLDLLEYFRRKHFSFKNENLHQLMDKLSESDRKLFNFNMDAFDWPSYLYKSGIGGRIYLLKDPMDTVPQAKKRLALFILLHYFIKATFFYFVFKWACVIFCQIFFY